MDLNMKLGQCFSCPTKPCSSGCPLENDIPEVIKLMKDELYQEAFDKLSETTVLSGVCGRICPHSKQCQGKCTRGIKWEPVNIGQIEARLFDIAFEKGFCLKTFSDYEENCKKNKKVAVIGGGPAGLTCAAFLARHGINVVIYEKHSELGGILSHGIPNFRLNKNVLISVIDMILNLGVNIKLNQEFGKDYTINELIQSFDAVFLGMGANVSSKMNIEGEELEGVYGANEVLEYQTPIEITSKRVAVIGGGNVAMDMARIAKKQNAKDVTVIYRRSEEQMPAEEKEIEEAKKEGIEFLFLTNIVGIFGNKKVEQIECVKTELIKKEGEARLSPKNIEGSNFVLDMDYVFMAVGSKAEEKVICKLGVETNKYNAVEIDSKNKTSISKVFAGGDLVGEKGTVAWASRSGRNAAESILKDIL